MDKLNTTLTDIPLKLDHGDSIAVTPEKPEKVKTNSLKRFFRLSKSSTGSSSAAESDGTYNASCENELKNVRSLQLRFGSFHKNDGMEKEKGNTEPSSSRDSLKSGSESRTKLQDRISNYWRIAFKKNSKKSEKKVQEGGDEQIKEEDIPNEGDNIENTKSVNL